MLGAGWRAEDPGDARPAVHVRTGQRAGPDVIELLGVGRAAGAEPPRGEQAARRGHRSGAGRGLPLRCVARLAAGESTRAHLAR